MAALGNALAGDDMRRYVSKGAMQDKLAAADAAGGLRGGGALMTDAHDESARQDWENRIGTRSGARLRRQRPAARPARRPGAPSPAATRSRSPGRRWREPSATRCTPPPAADGPWEPLDHAGRDVLAVPHPPYADTTGTPGEDAVVRRDRRCPTCTSRVTAAEAGRRPRRRAGPAAAGHGRGRRRPTTWATLPRPWRPMIGSEHLSHTLSTDTTGGRVIGEELTAALQAAHDELGVSHVRAHAILCDDLGVYREVDGEPVHDFSGVDRVYDHLRSTRALPGRRAVVHAARPGVRPGEDGVRVRRDRLAAEGLGPLARPGPRPGRTPGRPLRARGGGRALVVRGLERGQPRGVLVGHAGGVPQALRRHRRRRARRSTPGCVVGGPSSAAAGWVEELLAHAERVGLAGRLRLHAHLRQPAAGLPADAGAVRPRGHPDLVDRVGRHPDALQRGQRRGVRRHLPAARDGSSAHGPRSSRCPTGWSPTTSRSSAGRRPCCTAASACAPSASCASRAGGRWPCSSGWAATGSASTLDGDGAGSLVEALGSRSSSGEVAACWRGTSPSTRPRRPARADLARPVTVAVTGLEPGASYVVHHDRVDDDHSDIASVWGRIKDDDQDWPTDEQWAQLRAADRLDPLGPDETVVADARRPPRGHLRPAHARDVVPDVHAGLTGDSLACRGEPRGRPWMARWDVGLPVRCGRKVTRPRRRHGSVPEDRPPSTGRAVLAFSGRTPSQSTCSPYISPSGSAISSIRAPSGSVK